MSRDIAPFGLRMPDDLKVKLASEAKINGRSLNSEIVDRLANSLHGYALQGHRVTEHQLPDYMEKALPDIERALLTIFRKLPPEKQLALLSLFN